MIESVELLSGAQADLFKAFDHCLDGDQSKAFYRCIDEKLDLIKAFPGIGARFCGDFQRVLELRFSYGIYYRVHGSRLMVIAILPLRIDPGIVRERLK